MLQVNNINVYYDNIHALSDVSFEVRQGEIVTLIGANGAGKTTTLKSVSSVIKPRSGEIAFKGTSITDKGSHELLPLGMAHVPEGRRVFSKMTVEDMIFVFRANSVS